MTSPSMHHYSLGVIHSQPLTTQYQTFRCQLSHANTIYSLHMPESQELPAHEIGQQHTPCQEYNRTDKENMHNSVWFASKCLFECKVPLCVADLIFLLSQPTASEAPRLKQQTTYVVEEVTPAEAWKTQHNINMWDNCPLDCARPILCHPILV